MKLRDMIGSLTSRNVGDTKYTLDVEEMRIPSPVEVENTDKSIGTPKYTISWVGKVALMQGYSVNSDDRLVSTILAGLSRNNGICQTIGRPCVCNEMKQNGICKAGLFDTISDRKISSRTKGIISK